MEEFTTIINEYVRSELLVIVPVLYIIARNLNASKINKQLIPMVLMAIAVIMAGIYTFATVDTSTIHMFLMAVFSTLVQGILLSGTAVFGGILAQTVGKPKDVNSPK